MVKLRGVHESPGELANMWTLIPWLLDGARESVFPNRLQDGADVASPRTWSKEKGI